MRASLIIAGIAGIAATFLFTRKAAASTSETPDTLGSLLSDIEATMSARGIRNNNPGNIRATTTLWRGEVASADEKSFEVFDTPEDGIRAMAVIIKRYQKTYGLHTLRQIITRWAPPNENDTASYIKNVSTYSGIDPDAEITDINLTELIAGMIKQENGIQPYTFAQIDEGVSRA